jgi:hypothetical protein
MRRTLRETEPQLPSTMITSLRKTELNLTASHRDAEPPKLISQLKGDLDWIVMKTLEKDRNRRYETANGLALDIQRYLENEPVLARPPSQIYRLQKLVRRNKILFASGAAVAAALLIGLGLSTWLFIRERATSQREARLRTQAEDRAKITQAVMDVGQDKYDDADEALRELKSIPPDPTLDSVTAFRSVGEWMALQRRWLESAESYATLIKIDTLDTPNQIALDYEACGVVLAENANRQPFEDFWQMAVNNFSEHPSESVFIVCVLLPLDKSQIAKLKPTADFFEKRGNLPLSSRITQWTFMPIALWKYRCGDYDAAAEWSLRGLAQKSKFSACVVDLRLILAMADYQRGQSGDSCSQLAQCRETVEAKLRAGLDHGRAESGYWFDWDFASLLTQEATTLIDCHSTTPEE